MAKKPAGRDRAGVSFKQTSLLSIFSSSPATGTPRATSAAASSSPAPSSMRSRADPTAANGVAGPSNGGSGSGAGRVNNGLGGRALGGTRSEPTLGLGAGAAMDSDADDDDETAASSSLGTGGRTAPRKSPRLGSAAITSSASTIKAGAVKKELSPSPSRAKLGSNQDVKPIISQDSNGKAKGKLLLEISDSDEEAGKRGAVLAPSSVSPSTRQRRREALEKRITVGKDGRQELDLTLSSSPERTFGDGGAGDDTDSDDEIVIVSRASSRRPSASPARSTSSRASSSKGSRTEKGVRASSLAPPTSPSKGKGRETPVPTSPRLTRLNSVSKAAQSAPAVSSPLAKNAPRTPRKGDFGEPIPVNSASRTLRSASKSILVPAVAADKPASPLPYSPRLREQVVGLIKQLAPAPAINVTTATSSSPPRGLPQTANLAILTTPPRIRPSLTHGSSDLTSLASSVNPSPTRPSTPTRTAAFAALLAATRTPGGGPSYIRDPSGSPLSSAGPTPKKPLSRNATWPASGSTARRSSSIAGSSSVAGSKRKPKFEITIDAPPSVTKIVDGKKVVVVMKEKPRKTPVRASSKMRRARKMPTSEWDDEDEEMRDVSSASETETEDDNGPDDSFATAREGSPSPAKSRASERKGKQRAFTPPSEKEDEEEKEQNGKSGSDSSSSAGSDSDDSDADDFAALLARATQRRADGQTLAAATTSPAAASTSTAPTTVSPAKALLNDGPRRSTREHHAPEHYSPSRPSGSGAAGSSSRSGAAMAKKAVKGDLLGFEKQQAGQKAAFDRLMKEKKVKQAKGSTAQRYAALMAGSDEEDKDSDSDASSSSDLAHPSALSSYKPLDAKIVGRALASSDHGGSDEDDDLPAPTAAKAKSKVDRIEQLVREEHEREKGKRLEGESRAQLRERTVWREGAVKMHPLRTVSKEVEGEGWKGAVAKVLKDAIARPSSFPSPIVFFSPLSKHGQGSPADYPIVCDWILSLICHPSIPSSLSDRLSTLLHLVTKQAARKAMPTQCSSILPASTLLDALSELGAKAHDEKAQENGSDDPDSDDLLVASQLLGTDKTVVVSVNDQRECVRRWCQVVRMLSDTSPRLLTDDDGAELLVFCVRLSLDPTSASLRSSLSWTISSLLNSMPAESPARDRVFRLLSTKYRSSRPQLQFEMAQMLPHDSLENRNLRKWLATSLLMNDKAFEQMQQSPALSTSVFPSVLSALVFPPPSSAFHLSTSAGDTAADLKLFEQAQILLLAVTDLGDEITTAPVKERTETRKVLDEIVHRLEGLDSKLRTDAKKGLLVERLRAKNLLLSLAHSITFQLRRARGQVGAGFGFSDEAQQKKEEKEERAEKKRKREEEETEKNVREGGRDGLKQARLSFGGGGGAAVAVNGAEEDEDEDDDLPAPSFM